MGPRLSRRGELDRIDAFSEWPSLTAPGETCGSPVSYPGIQQFFTLHVLLRWWNSCTSPVQKHTWIHLQLWVTFSDFLSLSSLLENIQCFEKALSPEVTHFPTKKTQYPPAFCLLGKADLCAFSTQHIFMSLRKPAAGALLFGAQWTAGKAAGVSLVLKNKWNPRAEEAESWGFCILLLTIYFSLDGVLKERGRQFWFFLIWGRINGQYNVYCSSVLSCDIDSEFEE